MVSLPNHDTSTNKLAPELDEGASPALRQAQRVLFLTSLMVRHAHHDTVLRKLFMEFFHDLHLNIKSGYEAIH